MYTSPEKLIERLKGQSNLELKSRSGLGRKHTIPHEKKVLIGVLAKTDTQENVAKAMGTSQENVSFISRGLNGEKINERLKGDIETASAPIVERARREKDIVSEKAIDVLMTSLGVVESKINGPKVTASDAATVAKNMAIIANKFSPRSPIDENFTPRILINIHGSKQKREEDFETIDVEAVQR